MVMEGETIHWGVMVYAAVHLGDGSPTQSTLVAPLFIFQQSAPPTRVAVAC